jgi:heme-degrading monooxygenase HmoA
VFSVIFEVHPKDAQHREEYLAHAKELKPELEQIDGFIDNERFESRSHEGRVLSLSTWRDEKAVIRWRTLGHDHEIQEQGRFEIFSDYFLRVGEITADSHVPDGQVLREERLDETEIGAAKVVTIVEIPPGADGKPAEGTVQPNVPATGTDGLIDVEVFDSIYNSGKVVILAAWRVKPPLLVRLKRAMERPVSDIGRCESCVSTACMNGAKPRSIIVGSNAQRSAVSPLFPYREDLANQRSDFGRRPRDQAARSSRRPSQKKGWCRTVPESGYSTATSASTWSPGWSPATCYEVTR